MDGEFTPKPASTGLRLVVVGAGYVGLVSAACLADLGHSVVCVDTDSDRIRALQGGRAPFFEPGLEELMARNMAASRLSFAASLPAIDGVAALFIAVGTPALGEGLGADLSAVLAVARQAAPRLLPGALLVTKSTVPPGTGDAIEEIVRARPPELRAQVVSNPEFLREGSAISDFQAPDRLIIGGETPEALAHMRAIYQPLLATGAPVLMTRRRTAELVKYAANAFLATKISFINEVADLCERLGADVGDVALGIGMDRRIGRDFLEAGPGYGGSCFPKDTSALLTVAREHGAALRVVAGAAEANRLRIDGLADRVLAAMGPPAAGRRVAILGLAFKPETDDVRDAPVLSLIAGLRRAGVQVSAYDPEAMGPARRLVEGVSFATDPYDCATNADAIVLMTHWDEFRRLDPQRLAQAAAGRTFIDLRNACDAEALSAAGFRVVGVGRAPRDPAPPQLLQRINQELLGAAE